MIAAFAVIAFSGGCTSTHRAGVDGTEVIVRNFAIDAPATLTEGTTKFAIVGEGPTMHELNIAATASSPSGLPVTAEGLVDDQEETSTFHHVGEEEGIDIGDHRTMTVTLPPGHYVMYCNMEGHYQAGMATEFTVTS